MAYKIMRFFEKKNFLHDLDMRGEPEMAWKIFIGI